MSDDRHTIGQRGESIAAKYLQKHGYYILDTNWHCRFGELDIVARKDEIIVFVEVKTRRSEQADLGFASITPRKKQRIIKTIYYYLNEKQLDQHDWRIDAIAVAIPRQGHPSVKHVEDAFDW